MRVSTSVLYARWSTPLASAHGAGREPRPLVLLSLETRDGVIGHGEAAPLQAYDGVSLAAVVTALAACEAALESADGDDHAATLAACRESTELPQALAAVDMALWDLAGRQLDQPIWELLGAPEPVAVAVNAVIGARDAAGAAAEAAVAVAAGFSCVKVKVGVGDDVARVRAVRAAIGLGVELRVDANGAYGDTATAVRALTELERFDIELCEEPVHGARALAAVAAEAPVAVAADESTADPALFSAGFADAVCLKIASAGGISGVLSQAQQARRHGYEIYLASTLDGPLGIAAALHAAVAIGPERHCGLSTLDRFAVPVPFMVKRGGLVPPPGPGLGDGLLNWYWQLS